MYLQNIDVNYEEFLRQLKDYLQRDTLCIDDVIGWFELPPREAKILRKWGLERGDEVMITLAQNPTMIMHLSSLASLYIMLAFLFGYSMGRDRDGR